MMKNISRSLAGLALVLATSTALAQTAPAPVFPHDKAVESATYLARQKAFATGCPFSASTKAALDRLDTMAMPVLGLTPDELKTINTDAQAAALELLKGDKVKDMACPLMESALIRQLDKVFAQKAPTPAK